MTTFPDSYLPLLIHSLDNAADEWQTAEIIAVFRLAYYAEAQHYLWHKNKDSNGLTSLVVAAWGHSDTVRIVATFSDGKRYEAPVMNDPDCVCLQNALTDIIAKHLFETEIAL